MIKIVLAFMLGIGFYGFLCYYQPVAESYYEQKTLQEASLNAKQLTSPVPLASEKTLQD